MPTRLSNPHVLYIGYPLPPLKKRKKERKISFGSTIFRDLLRDKCFIVKLGRSLSASFPPLFPSVFTNAPLRTEREEDPLYIRHNIGSERKSVSHASTSKNKDGVTELCYQLSSRFLQRQKRQHRMQNPVPCCESTKADAREVGLQCVGYSFDVLRNQP